MAAAQWWGYLLPGVVGKPGTQLTGTIQAPSKLAAQQEVAAKEPGTPASDVIIFGPYSTQQDAQNRTNAAHASGYSLPDPLSALIPNWKLDIQGISGWFKRGLKVLFGGVLMIVGVSKLMNVDNKITALAGKVPVLA